MRGRDDYERMRESKTVRGKMLWWRGEKEGESSRKDEEEEEETGGKDAN